MAVSAVNQFALGTGHATVDTLDGGTKRMRRSDLETEMRDIHAVIGRDGVFADEPTATKCTAYAGPPAYYEVPMKLGGAEFVMRVTMGDTSKYAGASGVWCDSIIDCL